MQIILASNSTADRDNLTPSSERLINCYPVPAPEGAKAPLYIRSSLGMLDYSSLPGPFLRAMVRVQEQIYAVSAGSLYRVSENGTATWLATIADDPNTAMAGHRDGVTISAGGAYYLWDGTSLTQPGSGRLTEIGSVAFADQYTLLSQRDGREVEWTEAGLPDDRNALYFRTAEGRDDNIVRIMALGGYVGVFKRDSTEVWAALSSGSSAFQRLQGAVLDKGLLGFNLICPTPGGVFFIASDRTACVMSGGGAPAIVSPPNVNQALLDGTPTHCFYYEDRGHQFCNVRFADRPAWVYDLSMGSWHERSSGAEHGPWNIVAAVNCYGRWHLADGIGNIYRLGTTPVDARGPMRRTIVSRTLYVEGERFSVPELEILGNFGGYSVEETGPAWLTDEYGFPLESDGEPLETDGTQQVKAPGRIWIRLSRDGGRTFGRPKLKSIGMAGKYRTRARFLALGQFRDMTVEVNMTDPHEVQLLSVANVRVG